MLRKKIVERKNPVGHLPFSDIYVYIFILTHIDFWGREVGFCRSAGCCDCHFQVWWNDLMGVFHAAIGSSGRGFFFFWEVPNYTKQILCLKPL